ncbi:SDR family oxidoreductase [Bacillus tianshenii]|nr:SDR family oxidoreductase [Bacillus tianshenii]
MDNISGKIVIITGAGSGLGREMAIAFAKEGANVVLCGRRMAKLEETQKRITVSSTAETLVLQADASIESDVKMVVQAAYGKFGKIDYLINNAAVFQQDYVADLSLESWHYQWSNNTTSVLLMMRECLPIMRAQKGGKIINITSGLAKEGAAGFAAYSASKAAVETLTYSVEEEESRNGIITHVFNPGVMKTELQALGEDPSGIAPYIIELAKSTIRSEKSILSIDSFPLGNVQTI